MRFTSLKRDQFDEKHLPDDIYKSVVSSLYKDPISLSIGVACCVAVSLVLFWKTGDPAQLIFSSLFFLLGMIRVSMTWSFHRAVKNDLTKQTYRDWEDKYNIVGALYLVILGSWYINGLIRSEDPYVQLSSLALILCYLAGIIGRNFASSKVVRSQVLISIFFLIGGTLAFDHSHGFYSVMLAMFLLPYLVATYKMSESLRRMLFNAVVNAHNYKTVLTRFDAALDNVTHGVAMIDKSGVLVAANERFTTLAGLSDWSIVDCHVSILEPVSINGAEHSNLGKQLSRCLAEDKYTKFTFRLISGTYVEAEYNSMEDGGVIVLSDISERKLAEKSIQDLANYDALTGLPNRRHFMEEITTYLKNSRPAGAASMYFIDLDNFKNVNDTLGHGVGDDLLRVVASRLKLLLERDSFLCRFGGDEFVLFCPKIKSQKESAAFARKILSELNTPIVVKNHKIDIGASVGISIYDSNESNLNTLLQHADSALYEAKARGRSTYVFYTKELGEAVNQKIQLEADLRKAIEHDEIELHYQPLFGVHERTITGCEALSRWNHPTLGNISPSDFIQLAEQTGLIVPLGEQTLRKAMTECKRWPDHMWVAVNVSSLQFSTGNIVNTVKRLLEETGLSSHKLIIEVTETAMIDNVEDMTHALQQLSDLGVGISLDDFGTGFSSLSYLHSLPFDKVKIDKSFLDNGVANERSLVLLQGVVDLIKRLGMKVVLEGIETREQLEIMEKGFEVDEYQGYLFFRPMSAADFSKLAHKKMNMGSDKNVTKIAYKS